MNINPEKQNIIKQEGNILVTANPGTGKTLLLAYKYVDLLKKGLNPEDILCLTFTNKARREMENRIIDVIKESGLAVDFSKLNVFTFHSYSLDNIEDSEVISSNLIRYTIYKYLRENEVLNYGDDYLLDSIVPKIESLMRYLKNFGILPKDINIDEVKVFIEDSKNFGKEELEKFLVHFKKIFEEYEKVKSSKGHDYSDMLLKFLALIKMPHYKYVLVDELQDVNGIEADISLKSGDHFFAVGDAKQAIFGFQGGSILNFKKFENSTKKILSENFRSTNEILNYAKANFISKTKDEYHKVALENLKNVKAVPGDKVKIIDTAKEAQIATVYKLIKKLSTTNERIAVITRTNTQIMQLSKEFKNSGLDHSSTFFTASDEAKENIITFLLGIFSNDVEAIKNSMFTPFFPITLQEAFEISKDKGLTLEKIYGNCPEYKRLREGVKTVEDINILFREKILPVALSYGEEYLMASLSMQNACSEALKYVDNKDITKIMIYLKSSDLLTDESSTEKNIILTTVHKAKGKEYDNAIYIPSKTNNSQNFVDIVVEAILQSKGINAKEELEEESLRINFVAFTRAKKRLFVLTDKPSEYSNEYSELEDLEIEGYEGVELPSELKKRAYSLFVNGDFEKAKKALENNDAWLLRFIEEHFKTIEHISFSRLKKDAYEYFTDNILKLSESSDALSLGSEVHDVAEKMTMGEVVQVEDRLKPYIDNIKQILEEIKAQGYAALEAEIKVRPPLAKLIPTKDTIHFSGKIDAVFKKDDGYLIVDWKTSKKTDGASEYRQQLEMYKRTYAIEKSIDPSKIKVAIAYIGLRKTINDGNIASEFDNKQPAKSAFETMTKKLEKFLGWKNNPKSFIDELTGSKADDPLIRSIQEQWRKEKFT
ncbi:MAG: ATP-dependent helicase [Nanoarchaeota archaeon]|nr:ATP-dependent helicase [Nanoarchaeota archaeon]MBU1005098.1 ATP-dependent helicase [Nanoarchaeota archaeon]MBU1945882.1 ATP-dependent helicase [Nanoarchaeota archaeon]